MALFAYATADVAGTNGFVAAFVGGMAFGTIDHHRDEAALHFTEQTGTLLSLVVWFTFGAIMLVPGLEDLDWRDVVFAVLALTAVRMIPVSLSLVGSGLDRVTVVFIGWFGPRGLATIVFGLIAVDSVRILAGQGDAGGGDPDRCPQRPAPRDDRVTLRRPLWHLRQPAAAWAARAQPGRASHRNPCRPRHAPSSRIGHVLALTEG